MNGREASLAFAAGAFGALVNSAAVWAAGHYGLTGRFGVHIAPGFSPAWLYPRLVWGGLWGFLFLLPLSPASWWKKGALLGLAPAAAQLLYFAPQGRAGMFSMSLGTLAPVFVVLFNVIWGLAATYWLERVAR